MPGFFFLSLDSLLFFLLSLFPGGLPFFSSFFSSNTLCLDSGGLLLSLLPLSLDDLRSDLCSLLLSSDSFSRDNLVGNSLCLFLGFNSFLLEFESVGFASLLFRSLDLSFHSFGLSLYLGFGFRH